MSDNIWFIDSRCSNHITGRKSMFHELDETQKLIVQLDNDKDIRVEGQGVVQVRLGDKEIKYMHNVQWVSELGYNLLSVGS